MTTSIAASADTPIVQRSWGLLGGNQFYGPNFYFNGFMKTGNYLSGVLLHFGLMLGAIMLAISPVRQLVKKYVYQPGDGPTKEEVRKDRVEYRAIGHPDVQNSKSSQAFCKATFEGSLYTRKHYIHHLDSGANLRSHWHILSRGSYDDFEGQA